MQEIHMFPLPYTLKAPVLDHETFLRLVKEGQELRREFELKTAPMRVITPDDLKRRSR